MRAYVRCTCLHLNYMCRECRDHPRYVVHVSRSATMSGTDSVWHHPSSYNYCRETSQRLRLPIGGESVFGVQYSYVWDNIVSTYQRSATPVSRTCNGQCTYRGMTNVSWSMNRTLDGTQYNSIGVLLRFPGIVQQDEQISYNSYLAIFGGFFWFLSLLFFFL